MKHLFIFIFLIPIQVIGQTLLTKANNAYRIGDLLSVETMEFLNLDYQQEHLLIDLGNIQSERQNDKISFYGVEDSKPKIIQIADGKRTYFFEEGNLLAISGEECNLYKLEYDLPERWLSFPMDASCQLNGNFSSTGHYCHRIALRKFGNYQTSWTGKDKLLLENGDTLKDLSRLQTKRDFAIQTFPIDTLSKSLPAYTTDSVIHHLASASQRFEELIIRWYAKGYRYPVLEAYALYKKNGKGIPLKSYTLYVPPRVQELLTDSENESLRIKEDVTQQGNSNQVKDETLTYQVVQDRETHTVIVKYKMEEDGKLDLTLASATGIVFRRAEVNDCANMEGQKRLSYAGLPPGEYVVFIGWKGNQFCEKISVRQS